MTEAFAIRLPRVRRFRRPPARLIETALKVIASAIWIAYSVTWGRHSPAWGGVAAVLWVWNFQFAYRKLRNYLVAYQNNRRLTPVRKGEWGWTIFVLLWGITSFLAYLVA